jgi:sporulation protein YlmC with PRC-barrel domain
MTNRKDLLDMPVMTIDEGAEAGHITGLVIDPISVHAVALIVSTNERFNAPKAVPFPLVQGLGEDAVMIENKSAMAEFSSLPELTTIGKTDSELCGLTVIARTGKIIGYVEDFAVDDETGRIESFLVRLKGQSLSVDIDTKNVITIGSNALIVIADTVDALDS